MPKKRYPTISSGKKKRERDKKLASKEAIAKFETSIYKFYSRKRKHGARSLKGLLS